MIWHAVFDANSGTWLNAEPIAQTGAEPVSSLSLVASSTLVDGVKPGLVVVWQQGKLNGSDLYYTAAQYDENRDLQWLASPQAITSDQVGDLEPTVTVVDSTVVVVGSKVDFHNVANQSIREDADIYGYSVAIQSAQFTANTDPIPLPASYTPQLSSNGLLKLGGITNNTQPSTQSIQPSNTVQAFSALATTTSESEQPGTQPVGAWNTQTYFESSLLKDWKLLDTVPEDAVLRTLIKPFLENLEMKGVLSGGTTLPLAGTTPTIFLQSEAQIEWDTKRFTQNAPWAKKVIPGFLDPGTSPADLFFTKKKTSQSGLKVSGLVDSSYNFALSSYELQYIDNILGVTAGFKFPLPVNDEFAGFFKADANGSLGVNFNLLAYPSQESSESGDYSPKSLTPFVASILGQTLTEALILAKAITTGSEANVLAAEMALNVAETFVAAIAGTTTGLNLSVSASVPIFAGGITGKAQIPFVPFITAEVNGGFNAAPSWAITDAENLFRAGFPFGLEFRVGPLGFGINFDPGWTWYFLDKQANADSSQLVANNQTSESLATLSQASDPLVQVSSTATPTASAAGSLITVDFQTTLASGQLPSPESFTVKITDNAGNSRTIPVFNVLSGSATSVVLQLEEVIPISENYDYTNPVPDPTPTPSPYPTPTTTSNSISLTYLENDEVTDSTGTPIQGFTDLTVANKTPNTLVYNYSPVSGNSNDYSNPSVLLAFNEALDSSQAPDPARFAVSIAQKSYTPSSAQVTNEGVVLTFSSSSQLTNSDLQNVTITYNGTSTPGSTPLQDVSGNPIQSFSIDNGFSAQVSQSFIAIGSNNPNLSFSSSPQNYALSIINPDSSTIDNVTITKVATSGNNALLSLSQNVSPEQIVTITYTDPQAQPIQISSLVTGIAPPAITTQTLLNTIEGDLAQDSSPVLIQLGPTNSSALAAWVSDVYPLDPIAGVVNGKIIQLTFIGEIGNNNNNPQLSQFTITDSNNNSYIVTNIAITDNTLELTLNNAVPEGANVNLSYVLLNPSSSSGSTNLFLENSNTSTALWVNPFTNFSLTNRTSDSTSTGTPPSLLGAGSVVQGVKEKDGSTGFKNQIILVFDTTLTNQGVGIQDFTVVSNGKVFTLDPDISVKDNTVVFTVNPPNGEDLIGFGDLVTVSYSGQSLGSSNGNASTFSNQPVTTAPSTPTTVIKYALVNSGQSSLTGQINSIPGSSGLNFNPEGASQNGTVVLIWTNVDSSAINTTNLIPGEFSSVNDTKLINDSFNNSSLYYSIYDVQSQTWSTASLLPNQPPGPEGPFTIAALGNGAFMAAWVNYTLNAQTNQLESSTIYTSTLTSSGSGAWNWSTPITIDSVAKPDPLTELRIVSLNGSPTVFWTETQPSSYSQLTIEESPLLYYRLAESAGSNTLVNEGIYGAGGSGTYKGTVSFNQVGALENPKTNSGDLNPAVLFNAQSSATSSLIPLSGNRFSLEFWFNVPTLPSADTTIDLVSVSGLFDVNLTSNGSLALDINGQGLTANNFTAKANTWYYVVAVYDGSSNSGTLYINGSPSGTLDALTLTVPAIASVTLASSQNTSPVYLDEVAIYGDALIYNDPPNTSDFSNLTAPELSTVFFNNSPITNKFKAQYNLPLPSGPNTNYVSNVGNSWGNPLQIKPSSKLNPTQLSDANNTEWDLTSFSQANLNGSVNPNGTSDLLLPLSLTAAPVNETIDSIIVSATNENGIVTTWGLGNISSTPSLRQLAVVQGNQLLNPINPATKFSYTVLSPTVDFDLYLDPGNNNFTATTQFKVTINFKSGQPYVQSLQAVDPKDLPLNKNADQVISAATVTEANDSSLALIDSGFIINTSNPNIGYVVASADYNNDGKSDVAIGNRGYTNSNQGVSVTGTVQVLFGGGEVLANNQSSPLTATDSQGLLITGISDSGQGNGDFPLSMASGDINGDGIADLVIGDPSANKVYVIYGSSRYGSQPGSPAVTLDVTKLSAQEGYVISGPSGSSVFGFAVAVGNFNSKATIPKSGLPYYPAGTKFDIAIGDPGANNGNGAVYIVYDGSTFVNTLYPVSAEPANVGEQAGYSLAVSSLLTSPKTFTGNTTSDDLIVGAIGFQATVTNQWNGLSGLPASANQNPKGQDYPATSTSEIGAVYVYQSNGTTANTLSLESTYTGINLPASSGTANNSNLGSALFSGDLNADKVNDLAMAAPGDANNQGVIYVVAGGKQAGSTSPQAINTVANLSIVGGLPLSQTGTVLTSPGDLNDDQNPDFLITAPDAANGTGQSYVLFSPLDLNSVGAVMDLNITANASKGTFLLNGNLPFQLAGAAASGVGDINGDNVDDLMITAPNAGQLYVVYGHPWLADDGSIKLANISGDNGFVVDGDLYAVQSKKLSGTGNDVVMLGDVNGDGFDDLLAAGSSTGAILAFGASTQDLLDAAAGVNEVVISIANSGSIKSVFSAGDFNGDGFADIGVVDGSNNFYLISGASTLGPQESLVLDITKAGTIYKAGIANATAIGDYNGDGYDDLLLSGSNAPSSLYLGNRLGALNASSFSITTQPGSIFGSLGDINADGFGDFGFANPTGNGGNGGASLYLGALKPGQGVITALAAPKAIISTSLPATTSSWFSNNFNPPETTKFNSAPSLEIFNDRLYMAYTGTTKSSNNGSPFVQWSSDGVNWEGNTNYEDAIGSSIALGQSSTGVTIKAFNNQLFAAWLNGNKSAELVIASASAISTPSNPAGLEWTTIFNTGFTPSYVSPALAVLDNTLYVFYATGGEYQSGFEYISSSDGIHWSNPTSLAIPAGYLPLGAAFAVTSDADNLYMSYVEGNNTSTAVGQVFATYKYNNGVNPTWTYTTFNTAPPTPSPSVEPPLRGSGLIDLGGEFYHFFLPYNNSGTFDFTTSTTPGDAGSWSNNTNLPIFNNYWYTNPNPILFQEKLFLGYGIQSQSGGSVEVGVSNSNNFFQPNQTQRFGQALEDIGDFNGDGIADFAILAPGFYSNLSVFGDNNTNLNNLGAVLVYYGSVAGLASSANPDLVLGTPPPSTSCMNIANNQALLLSELAPAGDINGDGYDDLIVSSSTTALTNSNTTDGVVYVVFGGAESVWGANGSIYSATKPFNIGNLSPVTNQITLYFTRNLDPSAVPAASTFTVSSGLNTQPITVQKVSINSSSPSELTLTLSSEVNLGGAIIIRYAPPSSGASLAYASGSLVGNFTSSNDTALATLGAPTFSFPDYTAYGFQVAGLPSSLAGISLDGAGDVNGDGFSDFLIGAPGDNDNLAFTLFGSDFKNTVSQTGTIGADVMVGSPTGDSFLAGQGNDVMDTGGGFDVVYAGPGDDYISVNDTYFRRLDGGSGLDVLALEGYNGQAWDLTTLSPGQRLRNLEFLVSEGYGSNVLTLNAVTVTGLSSNNTLAVIMDGDDTLRLSSEFSFAETIYQYNTQFAVYTSTSSAATVLVKQPQASVTIDKSVPHINTPAPIFPSTTAESATPAPQVMASVASASRDAFSSNSVTAASGVPTKIYVSSPTVSERSGRANFTVTRTGDLDHYVWVDYYTQDGDGKAGDRYIPVAGQLVFAPGETIKTVTVLIPNNGKLVGNREFSLNAKLEGETTDPNAVPVEWQAAMATPKEQIRRWALNAGEAASQSVSFNVTTTNSINRTATLDLDLKGAVIPQIWNPAKQTFQAIPFNDANGIAQFIDVDSDYVPDLYRLRFEDGGSFDGDGLVNGLVALNVSMVQLKTTAVPAAGGLTQGTEGNNHISAQNSTGTNRLEGLGGTDVLIGSPQRDVLLGGEGNDILKGGAGVDQLYGGPGDDLIDGGSDRNFLYGGSGADSFVLRVGNGPHRVMDFSAADGDSFLLENLSFSQLSFMSNQVMLGTSVLATVSDENGKPVTGFAANPTWFHSVQTA